MDKKLLSNLKKHAAPTGDLPVAYIITATVETISDQRVLYLSFFDQKNKKKSKDKAKFKVFIWGNSYISQKQQDDESYKWSNARITNLLEYRYSSHPLLIAGCYLLDERETISDFLKTECLRSGDELEAIDSFQEKIMKDKLKAKHAEVKKKIDDVMAKVLPLPKDFETWVYKGPFGFSRYIYYKREGRKIMAFCTECKKEFVIPESKNTRKNVKHGHSGICPKCNKKIVYTATGKTKQLIDNANFTIMQKFEDGLIVRYFSGSKIYREHYMNPSLRYYENIREIYSVNNGILKCKKYDYADFRQTGEHRWCDDTGVGPPNGYLYTRNLNEIIKGTSWRYSCIYSLIKEVKTVNVYTFLTEFIKHPAIEYFIKLKLFRFVYDHVILRYSPVWNGVNFKGKGLKEIFGIDKSLFLQMQRMNLGDRGLRLIKEIHSSDKSMTDQQIRWVLNNLDTNNIFLGMLRYSTPQKIINYVQKQSNNQYLPNSVMTDWSDYLSQCKDLKFDITNTFVLYPKNLKEKHEEYTILNQAKGLEKYNAKVKKAYQTLDQHYSFSNKVFLIRPARSVEEIVKEGHNLRHCVAGKNYVEGVANGSKAIMFIRKIDDPDTPFFTLDLNLSQLSVYQCRGYKNCDMPEAISKFIDRWKSEKLTSKKVKERVRVTVPA